MNTEIFIVSCAKHFDWLEYCLKSIGKFASGFSGVTVLVPQEPDYPMAVQRFFGRDFGPIPFRWPIAGPEWPGKGMLWHMAMVMHADEWCPGADFILHTDSDCVFSEPVTPDDYFVDGKPVLMHARFDWLAKQQANLMMWKIAAEKALGWKVDREFMRRHPAVHYRAVYEKARDCIHSHTHLHCHDYIRSGENAFPQQFAEYPTLGAVAWKHFHNLYAWRDQETEGFPHPKIVQFSSGNSPANLVFHPSVRQHPVVNGKPFECTPDYFLK